MNVGNIGSTPTFASCTGANVKACDAFGSTYCCDAGQDAPTMVNGECQCKQGASLASSWLLLYEFI
jgi:hypothetical protein